MVHFLVDEQEIRQHNFFPIIRDASRPNTLHDAIAYDGRKVDNADAKPVSFVVSTSNWHVLHLIVLHVLLIENLPLDRIFPSRFLLPETHPLVSRVRESFSLPREAVKRGAYSIDQPLTYQFYSELSDLLRTGIKTPSPPTRNTEPRAIYSTNKVDTDSGLPGTILSSSIGSSSGSSYMASNRSHPDSPLELNVDAEDTNEIVTNHMVFSFIAILSNMLYSNKSPAQPRPEIFIRPDNLLLMLMGFEFRSINDGSGWKTRFSKSQSQWVKTGGAPLFTLECKRRCHGKSPFQILAQEAGELLAVAGLKYANTKYDSQLDRQAFLIGAHHTTMYISTAYVSPAYLDGCRSGRIPDGEFLVIRQSQKWDLGDAKERINAALAFLGCLSYLMNDTEKVESQ